MEECPLNTVCSTCPSGQKPATVRKAYAQNRKNQLLIHAVCAHILIIAAIIIIIYHRRSGSRRRCNS